MVQELRDIQLLKMSLKELVVKELARFKTLAMVQKYVRGFRASNFDKLDQSPRLTEEEKQEVKADA